MVIVETSIFTRRITSLLSDDAYKELQNHLVRRPESGDVVRGGGGLRKVRWSISGRGKRGGLRILYYWQSRTEKLYMLFVFEKNEQDNLTSSQLKTLRSLIEQELK